jgi:hypothetical protein
MVADDPSGVAILPSGLESDYTKFKTGRLGDSPDLMDYFTMPEMEGPDPDIPLVKDLGDRMYGPISLETSVEAIPEVGKSPAVGSLDDWIDAALGSAVPSFDNQDWAYGRVSYGGPRIKFDGSDKVYVQAGEAGAPYHEAKDAWEAAKIAEADAKRAVPTLEERDVKEALLAAAVPTKETIPEVDAFKELSEVGKSPESWVDYFGVRMTAREAAARTASSAHMKAFRAKYADDRGVLWGDAKNTDYPTQAAAHAENQRRYKIREAAEAEANRIYESLRKAVPTVDERLDVPDVRTYTGDPDLPLEPSTGFIGDWIGDEATAADTAISEALRKAGVDYHSEASKIYRDTMWGTGKEGALEERMTGGYEEILSHFPLADAPVGSAIWSAFEAIKDKAGTSYYDDHRDRAIAEWKAEHPGGTIEEFSEDVRRDPFRYPLRGDPEEGKAFESPYFERIGPFDERDTIDYFGLPPKDTTSSTPLTIFKPEVSGPASIPPWVSMISAASAAKPPMTDPYPGMIDPTFEPTATTHYSDILKHFETETVPGHLPMDITDIPPYAEIMGESYKYDPAMSPPSAYSYPGFIPSSPFSTAPYSPPGYSPITGSFYPTAAEIIAAGGGELSAKSVYGTAPSPLMMP